MRGFAIAPPELPVVVVNGRDYSQGGKAFTLRHELCHILLGESAISNGTGDDTELKPADRRVERFCDAVAAATLMPRELVASLDDTGTGVREWSNDELKRIGDAIGVSRQALLLRFVALKRASCDHYNEWAKVFEEEKKSVPIKRHVMLMSWNGRGFTRLMLRSYYDQRITLNDVSSYLGAKVNHIPVLERAAFRPAE
jgi:Zn-dependent peptidase ImmA (M78 family)